MISIIRDFFQFYASKKAQKLNENTLKWLISGYVLLLSFKSIFGFLRFILLKNNLITSTNGPGSPEEWIRETSFNIFA